MEEISRLSSVPLQKCEVESGGGAALGEEGREVGGGRTSYDPPRSHNQTDGHPARVLSGRLDQERQ